MQGSLSKFRHLQIAERTWFCPSPNAMLQKILLAMGTTLHLLLIENQGACIVPYATVCMLQKAIVALALTDPDSQQVLHTQLSNHTFGEVLRFVQADAYEYIFINPMTTNPETFVSTHGHIQGSFGNLAAYLGWLCVLWFLLFQLLCFLGMLQAGALDYRSGNYLAFTWRQEAKYLHKAMVIGLLAVSFPLMIGFLAYLRMAEEKLLEALDSLLTEYVLWAYGVYKLLSSRMPPFHWRSKRFRNLTFNRTLCECILTNDEFALRIQSALVQSSRKQSADMQPGSVEMSRTLLANAGDSTDEEVVVEKKSLVNFVG